MKKAINWISKNKNFMPFQVHNVSLYPSQMDICFSEKCNLDCTYCFVNRKSNFSGTLNFDQIKKAVDIFYALPNKEKAFTFTTSEPLLLGDLFRKTILYIFSQADKKNLVVNVFPATNGVLLTKDMADFIKRCDSRFNLNLSLDGKRKSHDVNRVFHGGKSSVFDVTNKNLKNIPNNKVSIIFTIAPSEVASFKKNIDFLSKNNFKKIDFFPQMFRYWKKGDLEKLGEEIQSLSFRNNLRLKKQLNMLNRASHESIYAKIHLGPDGNFYLFEWVVLLPYRERKKYIIGDLENGVNLEKRVIMLGKLFKEVIKESSNKCVACPQRDLCCCPIQLHLWCKANKKNFNKYLDNFCSISKMMAESHKKLYGNNKKA